MSNKDKLMASREAEKAVRALVRQYGLDRVLKAALVAVQDQADSRGCDLGEALYGNDGGVRCSQATIDDVGRGFESARVLARDLWRAAKAYEAREGYTLDGFPLPRHHHSETCEGCDQ